MFKDLSTDFNSLCLIALKEGAAQKAEEVHKALCPGPGQPLGANTTGAYVFGQICGAVGAPDAIRALLIGIRAVNATDPNSPFIPYICRDENKYGEAKEQNELNKEQKLECEKIMKWLLDDTAKPIEKYDTIISLVNIAQIRRHKEQNE